MLKGYGLNDELLSDLDWPTYSIYMLKPMTIGRVVRLLAEESDGDMILEVNSDNEGNTVYTISGIVDDRRLIEQVQQKCVEQGIEAQFSY